MNYKYSIIKPRRDEVPKMLNSPDELEKYIDKYYENKDALIWFVWYLMNNAWRDGYEYDRENLD